MLIDIIKQIASRPAVDRGVVEAIVAEGPVTPQDLLDRLQKLVNAPCELSHSGTTLSDLVSNAQVLKDSDPKRDVFVVITETDCSVKNPVREKKATTDE